MKKRIVSVIGLLSTIGCFADYFYDPQPYTPITNSPAQLAEKQAALNAVRTEWATDDKWDAVNGKYSESFILKIFSQNGMTDPSSVTNHFNEDGSWYKNMPTNTVFSNEDYDLNHEYLMDVLALAYLNKYGGEDHKQAVYSSLSWYFDNGYAAPHKYNETFIYGDTKTTTGQQLVRIGHMMYDEIHAERVTDPDVEILFQQIREYCRAFINANPQMRGPNWALRMDECLVYLLFTNEVYDMDEYEYHWKKALSFNRWETEATGIYPDWSSMHHGEMNYWTQYGMGQTKISIQYGEIFKNKPWAYEAEELDFIANCLIEGLRWNLYRGEVEYSSAPKVSVIKSSATSVAVNVKDQLGRLIVLGGDQLTRKAELIDIEANYILPYWSTGGTEQPTDPEFAGHRYFWNTEHQVHRRSNFGIYVRRCSQRVRAPEARDEAPLPLNLGMGYTPFLRRGDEYRFSRLGWDYRHVPGTTVEQGLDISGGYAGSHHRGLNLFSGGVTDGEYGFGAFEMNLVRYETDLSGNYQYVNGAGALKGTFFFDDGMLALGQKVNRIAIVDGVKKNILTTINNVRRLTDVVYSVNGSSTNTISTGTLLEQRMTLTDVTWFHHDGMGYVIWPSSSASTELVVSFGERPFNPYLEADKGYKTNVKLELGTDFWDAAVMNMFRLWIDHGVNPVDDTYTYAVLPDCTLEELEAYVANPPVQVITNSGGIQAVAHTNAGLYYASFANAGSVDFGEGKTVTADIPLMVMARKQGSSYTLTASNPTHRGLRRDYVPGTGPTVGTLYTGPVEVNVSGFGNDEAMQFYFPSERGEEGGSVQGIAGLPLGTPTTYVDWAFDDLGVGGVDSGKSATDWNVVTPETATPAWTVTQLGDDPASSLAVSPTTSRLVLTGKKSLVNGVSEAVLPFGEDLIEGSLSAGLGLNSGSTYTLAKFNLVNISGGVTNDLIDFNLQRNGTNDANLITTGTTNFSVNGQWEDVFNDVSIEWNNGVADIALGGSGIGDIQVTACTFLTNLPPNALLIRAGTSGNTGTRRFEIDRLTIELPATGYFSWIADFGISGTPDSNPDHDFDDDGFDNLSEFIAGTDPSVMSSLPRIGSAAFNPTNNQFILQWDSVEGRQYDVYFSNSLTGTFTLVEGDITSPRHSHTSVVGHAESSGFYRLEVKGQ